MKGSTHLLISIIYLSLFLLVSCTSEQLEALNDSNDDDIEGIVEVEYEVKFVAEYEGPDGTVIANQSEGPIQICVGDKVDLVNTTTEIVTTIENGLPTGSEENLYTDDVILTIFGEEGVTILNSGTSSAILNFDEVATICFDEPGSKGIILQSQTIDELGLSIFVETFSLYIEVTEKEPEPEIVCFIESEVVDNGLSTDFEYDTTVSPPELTLITNSLNGMPQEHQIVLYDAEGFPIRYTFETAGGTTLGTRNLNWNGNGQLAFETTEDSTGELIFRIDFNWDSPDDTIPIGGTITRPHGGGTDATDFTYTLDATGNNVAMVNLSRDGADFGRVESTFDNNPKIFTNVNYAESAYPRPFNTNNILEERVYDLGGGLTSLIQYTYDFTPEENCGQATEVEINDNGTITRRALSYVQFAF